MKTKFLSESRVQAIKHLYHQGAYNRQETISRLKCWGHMSKKSKPKSRYLDFLRKELAVLNTVKVNVFSDETLKMAAPDTHQVIRSYLERRIKEVDVLEGLPKKSKP